MSVTNNRICLCCGNKFSFCPNCGKRNTGYNVNFDSKECAELFNAVSGYNMKVSTKEKIKDVLDKYGVLDYSKYKESISSLLFNLFPINGITKKEETKEEKLNTEEITEAVVETAEDKQVTTEEKEPEVQTKSHKRRFSSKNRSYQKKEVELSDETGENEVETTGISKEE